MFSHEGHEMGDAWYFVDERTDTVHMFYLPINHSSEKSANVIADDLSRS